MLFNPFSQNRNLRIETQYFPFRFRKCLTLHVQFYVRGSSCVLLSSAKVPMKLIWNWTTIHEKRICCWTNEEKERKELWKWREEERNIHNGTMDMFDVSCCAWRMFYLVVLSLRSLVVVFESHKKSLLLRINNRKKDSVVFV